MDSDSIQFVDDDYEEEDEKTVNCLCKDFFCPSGNKVGTCVTHPGGKCFTAVEIEVDENDDEYPLVSYGCLPPNEMAVFQCRATLMASRERKTISCCDAYDFCNKHLLPVMPKRHINWGNGAIIGLSVSVCICLLVMILGFVYIIRKYERRIKKQKQSDQETASNESITNLNQVNNILNVHCNGPAIELVERSNLSTSPSSMSGISLNGLSQVTISMQMQIKNLIGKGKFGEVYKAKWRGERVAVKIFYPDQEPYWLRESEIYQTVVMRHENILGYVAADIKSNGNETQMLLITDFHRNGSLNDYLKKNTLLTASLLKMSKGIVSGLNFLHAEVFGLKGKPAIALKTLKSQNILVKSNGDCCISDFGSSVKFLSNNETVEITTESKLETRYQAPEILDSTIDNAHFESHKMADVYSFSLILWEMCSRTELEVNGEIVVGEYKMPYEEIDEDNFKEFVCEQKGRPDIPENWGDHDFMKTMVQIMEESWIHYPTGRLTALRIKKNLFKVNIL